VSRNYVFVHRDVRAVKLYQMTVGVFCTLVLIPVRLVMSTHRSLSYSSWNEGVSGLKLVCGKLSC